MKLKDLILLPECPEWIKDPQIRVEDEDIELLGFNKVIWKNGIWKNGIWKDGAWRDGMWFNGTWEYGIWEYGNWYGGIWEDGIWENGTWNRGIWKSGLWKFGIWREGTWHKGTWENGFKLIGQCKWRIYYNHIENKVMIGCKTKTIEEWDTWFAGTEEFETHRGTEEFKRIILGYNIAKACIEQENNFFKEYNN